MRPVLTLPFVLCACTVLLTDPLPEQPVDASFEVGAVNWTGGRSVYFAWRTFESQGQVGLCGAWAASTGGINEIRFDELLVQSGRIELGGEIVVNDISFFAVAPFVEDQPPAGTANCVRTGLPWEARYAELVPELLFAQTRFEVID